MIPTIYYCPCLLRPNRRTKDYHSELYIVNLNYVHNITYYSNILPITKLLVDNNLIFINEFSLSWNSSLWQNQNCNNLHWKPNQMLYTCCLIYESRIVHIHTLIYNIIYMFSSIYSLHYSSIVIVIWEIREHWDIHKKRDHSSTHTHTNTQIHTHIHIPT